MRTHWLAIVFLILLPFMAFGQKDLKKSAPYSQSKGKSSAQTISGMLEEAERLKAASPKAAIEKVGDALATSIAMQDALAEARCYNLLGEINLSISQWRLALENFSTASSKLNQTKIVNDTEVQKSLHGIGVAQMNLGNYGEALKSFEDLLKSKSSVISRVEILINVSEVYFLQGNYTEALSALDRMPVRKFSEDQQTARFENQRAKIYARMNEVEKAAEIHRNSIQRSRAEKPSASMSEQEGRSEISTQSAKEDISQVYQQQGRYDDEIALRENSIDFNMESKNFSEVSKDKVELSKALVAKGETAEAIRELEEAASIADTINDPSRQAVAYLTLADLYEKKGNPGRAIDTYKKYSQAVEKLERENQRKLAETSELIRTQRDIEELSKHVAVESQQEKLAQAMVSRQRIIIYALTAIILIIGVTSYFIYKNALASKRANQMLALKSLRSQMNPHFIFNALNSVNQFVAQNDERTANRFLSEFSRLMRLVLEYSQEDFIPLYKEEEMISLYLKLEHYRFRDKFEYEVVIDNSISRETVLIPPMLIQPYIENAVWHGLRYKESKGFLSVRFKMVNDVLKVVIEDDGIGRQRSAELKTENQRKQESTGLKNIRERLIIINRVYKTNFAVNIEDRNDPSGTRITLALPMNDKIKSYA